MKKWQKIGLIGLGIMLFLVLLGNFGLNFWLKHNLPLYLHKNSDYTVTYSTLDVDLGTGNILSTDIKIASKNPDNQNVIGMDGTVDSLKISRLGIFDALFRKKISSTDLLMVKPKLQVTLAKPIDDKTGKKRNPVTFENIRIKNGNILILQHNKKKYFSVKDLNLMVENLQMTEQSMEKKLPVVFDKYDISGKNFFFRPDNIYALAASEVTTTTGLMNIRNFRLVPLLSYAQFRRFYPKKRNLFKFQANEMDFQDIVLNDNKVTLKNVTFKNPDLLLNTTSTKPEEKQKSFTYDVALEDLAIKKGRVEIVKDGTSKLFGIQNLDMNISQLVMNEETAKGNIPPFTYKNFLVKGQNAEYNAPTQNVKVASLALNEKSGDFRQILITPQNTQPTKSSIKMNISRAKFVLDNWRMHNSKIRVNANSLLVDGANGSINAARNPVKKKADYSDFELPLTIKNIEVKNSNISYEKNAQPIAFKNFNGRINHLEMNEQTIKDGLPFKTGNYSFTTSNFNYKAGKFYNLSASLLKLNKNTLTVNNFSLKPTVSRSQFIRMIATERDLYDLRAARITVNGDWDLASSSKHFNASFVNMDGVFANIFRSKIPKDDPTVKPMYSELLRKIKFPLFINVLNLRNSTLEYEEDTPKSEGPGKLTFSNFNLTARNLNSGKMPGKPTAIPIDISCAFMNASPMKVKWNINTAAMDDAFSISGNITDLPAPRLNPFIEPYLKVRAEGAIQDLVFNYTGNKAGMHGTLGMKHKDLKVSVLNKEGEKNKILSTIANIFVKDKSEGKFPESVEASAERDNTKSFFNLLWKTTQDGLAKILIGADLKKIQNTVDSSKETLNQTKSDFKQAKEAVNVKVETVKEKVQKVKNPTDSTKKGGFLKRIFRKKEKKE